MPGPMSKTKSGVGSGTQPGVATSRTPEGRRTQRPPRGRGTPALGTRLPRNSAAPAMAEWMKRAKRLSLLLEEALNAAEADPEVVARIDRAWAAWELGTTSPAVTGRVAHLVDRAYVAMHEGSGRQSEEALQGCAHILYNGLPPAVRRTTDFPRVVELVRRLETERELWPAVVKTTADLLGWSALALTQAAHAIRVAMATKSTPL